MAEIGLAAAAYAEIGIEALLAGDTARAIGAFSSIPEESWHALAKRFPGFPERLTEGWTRNAVESAYYAAIEGAER
jgi:hypothetical protein